MDVRELYRAKELQLRDREDLDEGLITELTRTSETNSTLPTDASKVIVCANKVRKDRVVEKRTRAPSQRQWLNPHVEAASSHHIVLGAMPLQEAFIQAQQRRCTGTPCTE